MKIVSKCICIGENAGTESVNKELQLRLKSDNVDVSETMTEREYKLIKATIDCLIEIGRINER